MGKKLDARGIDWETIINISQFEAVYDKKTDIWFAQSKDKRPAVSIDCPHGMWVRVDPSTGEILGIEIEDFEKIFVKKHPELKRGKSAYTRSIAELIKLEYCAKCFKEKQVPCVTEQSQNIVHICDTEGVRDV